MRTSTRLMVVTVAFLATTAGRAAAGGDVSYVRKVPLPAGHGEIVHQNVSPAGLGDGNARESYLITVDEEFLLNVSGVFVLYGPRPPELSRVGASPISLSQQPCLYEPSKRSLLLAAPEGRGGNTLYDLCLEDQVSGGATPMSIDLHPSTAIAAQNVVGNGVVGVAGGQLYVTTSALDPISSYIIATNGNLADQISGANELAFAPNGLLYVWDYGNQRVQIFDLSDTGHEHQGSFPFNPSPDTGGWGFAISAQGRLYVGDGQGGGSVYDLSGNFIEAFTPPPADQGVDPAILPGDASYIGYDYTGNIYVMDDTGYYNYFDAASTPIVCGNSVVEAGEQCDDGNTLDGDCCSQTCQYEAEDAPCTSDDVDCTLDACDATGVCLHIEDDGDCDDANVCNGSETCDAVSGCLAGTPLSCGDGNVCNGAETCDPADGCESGTALTCDDDNPCTQDSCDSVLGCEYDGAPASVCVNDAPGKSSLVVHDDADPAKKKVQLKWSRGSFPFSDFGDPLEVSDYTLCVYDATGVVVGMTAPAGGMCGTKPCWRTSGNPASGISYKDGAKPPANDGIKLIKGKASASGKAQIQFQGAGQNVPELSLGSGLASPVTAQIHAAGGSCWQANFATDDASKNDAQTFSAIHNTPYERPDTGVTGHTGHIGYTSRHFGEVPGCRGRSVTAWTSG